MALANDSRVPVKDVVRDASNNPTTQTATYEATLQELGTFFSLGGDPITAGDVSVAAYVDGGIAAGTLQSVLEALADRIEDLENQE